ncbi:MAG: NAD(P)-dependent oxidoreductase [Promethearchaeota archaeon]
MNIGIIEPRDFSKKAIEILNQLGTVEVLHESDTLSDFIKDKEIIFIRLRYYIGKEFLDVAINLKFLCTPTTGLTHIDLSEIKKRNIEIISLKGESEFLSNIRATPEHTIGLVISLLRNYRNSFLNLNNPIWNRDKYWGHELFNNRVGLIGFGRIGKILAKYFNSFEAEVYFYDIDVAINSTYNAIRLDNLEELIKKSKIIILCASYNKRNKKFFDHRYIDLLKDKYFINISRGELIDEIYLIKKIKNNFFKGIALDVISDETKDNNNLSEFLRLTKKRNFILTPHISGATYKSIHATEEFIAGKLKSIIKK